MWTLALSLLLAQDPVPLGPLGGSASAVLVDSRDDARVLTASFADGLLLSGDGGRTFAPAGAGLPAGASIAALRAHPNVGGRVFALVDDRIYQSDDFGASWAPLSLVADSPLISLSLDASGAGMLAASGATVYRSADAGATWNAVFAGLILEQVQFAPGNDMVAYVGGLNGLARSTDGGQTWVDPGGTNSWVMAIAVDPVDENTVYIGGFARFEVSFDGGASFTPRGGGLPLTSFQFLRSDPNNAMALWGGVLDGIYVTDDGGVSWVEANDGFGGTFAPIPSDLAFDSAARPKLTSEGGFFVSAAGYPRWEQTGFATVEIYDVAVAKEGTYLASNFQGIYARRPGETFAPTSLFFDFGGHTDVIAIDPRDPGRWLSGGVGSFIDNALVRVVSNAGRRVENVYEQFGAGTVRSLAFDPFDPDRVLGGTWPAGFGSAGLIGSLDGGDRWADVPGTAGWSCAEVAWDPHLRDHAIAYLDSGFWADSFDGGATWQLHSGWPAGPSVFFAFDPFDPGVYYLGEDSGGLFRSDDAGATWIPLGVSVNPRSDLEASPLARGLLWVSDGDGRVLLSGDRGSSWVNVFTAPNGKDATGLAWDAASNALVIGTAGASAFALPGASPYEVIGEGLAGSGGQVPRLCAGNGLPRIGNSQWTLHADRLLPSSTAALYVGLGTGAQPLLGGTRYAFPPTVLARLLPTGAAGRIERVAAIPNDPRLIGTALFAQVLVQDAGAPQGAAFSPGLKTVLMP